MRIVLIYYDKEYTDKLKSYKLNHKQNKKRTIYILENFLYDIVNKYEVEIDYAATKLSSYIYPNTDESGIGVDFEVCLKSNDLQRIKAVYKKFNKITNEKLKFMNSITIKD